MFALAACGGATDGNVAAGGSCNAAGASCASGTSCMTESVAIAGGCSSMANLCTIACTGDAACVALFGAGARCDASCNGSPNVCVPP